MTRIFSALLLLIGMSWPAAAGDTPAMTTLLLVARDGLPDPNFEGSVVLVMNNLGPAPAGIIINRPTRVAVSRLFAEVESLRHVETKVYFGGPVELTSVSFLFRAETAPAHATEVLAGVYLSTDAEVLQKLLEREAPMDGLRIFIGHSGWGPGQLEAEIARGDWTLSPADSAAIFGAKPGRPWPDEATPEAGQRS